MRIGNLFYSNKPTYHKIDKSHEYHRQSLAQYILLKKYYVSISNNGKLGKFPYKVRVWLTFRNRFLSRLRKKEGGLVCFYCGKDNLTANHNAPTKKKYNGLATIDHYIPRSKGGSEFSESNLVCACMKCNGKKRDLMPEDFLKAS